MGEASGILLPCPFCGGAAEIERRGSVRASMIIVCEDCGSKVESGDVWGITMPEHYRWNKRVILPPKDAGLAERG